MIQLNGCVTSIHTVLYIQVESTAFSKQNEYKSNFHFEIVISSDEKCSNQGYMTQYHFVFISLWFRRFQRSYFQCYSLSTLFFFWYNCLDTESASKSVELLNVLGHRVNRIVSHWFTYCTCNITSMHKDQTNNPIAIATFCVILD